MSALSRGQIAAMREQVLSWLAGDGWQDGAEGAMSIARIVVGDALVEEWLSEARSPEQGRGWKTFEELGLER